jgi:hypothetical protein
MQQQNRLILALLVVMAALLLAICVLSITTQMKAGNRDAAPSQPSTTLTTP